MRKILTLASAAILICAFAGSSNAQQVKGKAEDFHHALQLCYQHSADHAQALYDQISNGELNMRIVRDYVDQIGNDLDHARTYHSFVHKTYSEADSKMIADEHLVVLNGNNAAATAFASLKTELEKPKPELATVKTLTIAVYEGSSKAAAAHRDAMKKLGIPDSKIPGA
jgi:hypothetical protein